MNKYRIEYAIPTPNGLVVDRQIIEADEYYSSVEGNVPVAVFYVDNDRALLFYNVVTVRKLAKEDVQ